ncbi:hypothetical protein GQ44DRAFT_777375 [Phaeosphaeriaceae sp. PMI808]|nr:hypothetical protein GQ44DRAFT_777375 [Phaeosphaeriaceae sp. PMI808]
MNAIIGAITSFFAACCGRCRAAEDEETPSPTGRRSPSFSPPPSPSHFVSLPINIPRNDVVQDFRALRNPDISPFSPLLSWPSSPELSPGSSDSGSNRPVHHQEHLAALGPSAT